MALIKDFIHDEHHLIFNDENHDEKPKRCKICGFLMFAGTPFYSCNISGCGVFLHEHCAGLPKVFRDTDSFSDVDFTLLQSPTSKVNKCLKCNQICENYIYSPEGTILHQNAGLHPLCAFPNELGTLHRSHRHHPLSPTLRKICVVCSACGEQHDGIFFSCQKCDYWLHQECASLPPLARHASHRHALALLYSYSFPMGETFWGPCGICKGDIPRRQGIYACRACNYGAHIKCVKPSSKVLTPEEFKKLITYLPPSEEDTVFPSLIIREASLELEESNDTNSSTTAERMTPKECHHHHPLTFHDSDHNDEILGEAALCNACVQPILSSTSYHSCSESHCHFLVHDLCAKLPIKIWGKLLDREMYLFTKSPRFFHVFQCAFCRRSCNGFGYSTEKKADASFVVDVECASAPRIIKHESHKNHILHLTTLTHSTSSAPGEFGCCSRKDFYFRRRFYQCISCDFKIHISCALLPRQVVHKFDKHPLQLNTNGPTILLQQQSSSDNFKPENYNFCEFCEEDIDLNFWFYSCLEGDQYFHVDCIPSVGQFSKFKFGGTVAVPCHPDHLLKSVRMLIVGSQTCGYCHATVQGFNDGYAFHCVTCDFWMHESCVYRSRGYETSSPEPVSALDSLSSDLSFDVNNLIEQLNLWLHHREFDI